MATSSPQISAGRASDWTLETLRVHFDALRAADKELAAERDRRYTEVAAGRAEALKIKEQGDSQALVLAREIQTYKDNAHNGLIAQLNQERTEYARKDDLAGAVDKFETLMRPVLDYMAAQQGRSAGFVSSQNLVGLIAGLVVAIIGIWVGTRS